MAEPWEYLHLRPRQRLAQRLAHVLLHDGIGAPDQQRRRVEPRQRSLQIAVDEPLVEHRQPHSQRDRCGVVALATDEVRVHRRRGRPPLDHERRVRIDRLLELTDLGGVVVGRLARRCPGKRTAARRDQHHAPRALRPVLGEGLRDEAAEGMPDDIRPRHPERIEQQLDVVGEIQPCVAALGLARASVAADVDQDQTKPRREIRHERHPVARAVGVAVDQHHRHTCRVTHRDVGQRLAVGQRDGLLHGVETVEVDLRGNRRASGIHGRESSNSHAYSCRARRQAWRRFVSRSENTRRTPGSLILWCR